MQFKQTLIDEFTLLESLLSAAQRLFDKGIIDSPDGGYLTDLGLDLIEHVTVLHSALGN